MQDGTCNDCPDFTRASDAGKECRPDECTDV